MTNGATRSPAARSRRPARIRTPRERRRQSPPPRGSGEGEGWAGPAWPSPGSAASSSSAQDAAQEIRLDVTRDTWLSNVGPEADGNNGGRPG